MRIYLHGHADKELSSARCNSHSQNGKELWVDSALRNKHPFQGRNNKVICFIPTLLLVIVPLPRHIFSQHSQQEVCKLALPSFEQLSHNKTHPRRFNCFYCVSQTLSSTSHTAFPRTPVEKLWFLGEEWRQDPGRCFQDSVTTSKAWAPLRRVLVEGEGKWKLNSRVWSKGRKGQDKLQTNGSSLNRFYGAMTRLLCLSLVGQW